MNLFPHIHKMCVKCRLRHFKEHNFKKDKNHILGHRQGEAEVYFMLQQYLWYALFHGLRRKFKFLDSIHVKSVVRVTSVNSFLYGDDFGNNVSFTTNASGAHTKTKSKMSPLAVSGCMPKIQLEVQEV